MRPARASTLTEQAIVLSAIIGASQITWGALAPILPLYAGEFDTTVAFLGPALAAFALGRAIAGIPAGILMRWWRPRPYLYVTTTGLIVTTAVTAVAATPGQLIAARLVAGLFAGATITIAFAVLIAGAPEHRRGSVMATASVVQLSAAAIGSFLGGWIADTWGLRAVFPLVIVPVVMVLVWELARPVGAYWAASAPTGRAARTVNADADPGASRDGEARSPGSPKRAFAASAVWVITVLAVVSFATFYARFAGEQGLIPTLAYDVAGVSATALGGMLAAGTALSIAALVPISRAVNKGARLAVFLPATALAATAIMLFPVATEPWVFSALVALYVVSSSIAGMVPGVVTADRVPRHLTGTTVGITRAAGDAGAVIGPLAVFALYGSSHAFWALASIAAVLLASALLFIPIARRRTFPLPHPSPQPSTTKAVAA